MGDEGYPHRVGWIGTGRMGYELVSRLLAAGVDVWVYNRTRAKAEPLADLGAKIVDTPAELAECEIVFTIVAGPKDVMAVTMGENGVLTRTNARPRILVDVTTIDPGTSAELRAQAAELGVAILASPVSGNPKVVKSGNLTVAVSGPNDAWQEAKAYIELFGKKVTYVGEADEARLVKICHNLMLGIVAQVMAETCVLMEAAGVSRGDYLEFLNDSVMGSVFTRYKTPAYVNLDYTPTFTWDLLRKDFELGLSAGRELDVPLPVSALVHQIVIEGMGQGYTPQDFAALLTKAATGAGLELTSENREVSDGL
ncbi:MAG: NAD(P)-dependent oxidoreductase [Acidimicrobiia bacterium]|nr:NAD(P)-dependent oxidoreductase [Acidimicrobiia bacterium]MDH5293425.1 NAD(P)-dependent oxidoreductase [Acidimicrobiia bacterium]